MSLLEKQLEELQKRKEQVDVLKKLIESVKLSTVFENVNADIADAIFTDVEAFITMRISEIENGNGLSELNPSSESLLSLDQNEIGVLKEMVYRLQNTPKERPRPQPQQPQRPNRRPPVNSGAFADDEDYGDEEQEDPQPPPRRQQHRQRANMAQQRGGRQDVVAFAMQHRGLDGKRVIFTTQSGQQIGGKVVGTEMPNILVQTDTGSTVPVSPDEITIA